jgi:hypothetical protein
MSGRRSEGELRIVTKVSEQMLVVNKLQRITGSTGFED